MKNKLALIFVSTTLAFSSTVLTIFSQSAAAGQVQNKATGACLDGNREGGVYTKGCIPNNGFQHWDFIDRGSKVWVLKSNATGRCLDSNKEGDVYASGCNSSNPYQRWVFSASDGGTYKNEATGRCLDSDNQGKVYTYGCAARYAGQKWNS
jgi:Ricin-type beta-trefoil lectin domain